MILNNTSTTNKGVTAQGMRHPVKKLHRIADKTIVVIDQAILNELAIDEESAWLEQQLTQDGILLKPKRFPELPKERNTVCLGQHSEGYTSQ